MSVAREPGDGSWTRLYGIWVERVVQILGGEERQALKSFPSESYTKFSNVIVAKKRRFRRLTLQWETQKRVF